MHQGGTHTHAHNTHTHTHTPPSLPASPHLQHSWNGWKEFMYLQEAKRRAIACWQWRCDCVRGVWWRAGGGVMLLCCARGVRWRAGGGVVLLCCECWRCNTVEAGHSTYWLRPMDCHSLPSAEGPPRL